MEIDNDRDRFTHGYDAGLIVDGEVVEVDNKLVLVDDEGVGFEPTAVLDSLKGKKVRLTIVSLDSIEKMEEMFLESQKSQETS